MSLAREIVELEAMLRKHGSVDPFLPVDSGGMQESAECTAQAERIERSPLSGASALLRLCLQTLRVQHEEMLPRLTDAELVATLPTNVPGIARPTRRVIHEMVSSATREIILLGYEFTDVAVLDLLVDASNRGTDVIVIIDRSKGAAARILDAWPATSTPPRIYQDRVREDAAPYSSMHAKCLLVDGRSVLVTSANFTFHGLEGNIEIGVRIGGRSAEEARKIFSYLVESGVVEPVGNP